MCPEAVLAANVAVAINVPAIGLLLVLVGRELAPAFSRHLLALRPKPSALAS